MQRSYKSFAARLAKLEALERTAEAAPVIVEPPPNLDLMDDAEAFWQAAWCMRKGFYEPELSAPLGPVRFAVQGRAVTDAWYRFYTALETRVNRLMDAMPKPILFLHPWEIGHAIAAIDAGLCSLPCSGYCNSRGMRIECNYRLELSWGYLSSVEGEEREELLDVQTTLTATNRALDLLNRQRHYPQPRDFGKPEMTTLGEWRQWLEELPR